MKRLIPHLVALAAITAAASASAQITLYENDGYGGRSYTAQQAVDNFGAIGFNDRASSVVVQRQGWQVCEDAGFNGRCVVLQPGRYP